VWKIYIATLAEPLTGSAAQEATRRFASGTMVLGGTDIAPLLPAQLAMLDDVTAQVAISEGKYHQVCVWGGVGGRGW
jgi:16S rRNA U516 pseudouridylate synthase RsuA-like enzyme